MTYFREAMRALKWAAPAAITISTLFAAPVQAANVALGSGCTNGAAYTSISFASNGDVTLSCTAPASNPGTIAFSPSTYSVNPSATVTVTLTRSNGTSGAASSSVAVQSGGCTVAPSSVNWIDGDGAAKTVTVTAPSAPATCALAGNAVTSAGSATIAATVNVLDPNQPGTFDLGSANSSVSVNGPAVTVPINRVGGSNGEYDVAYTFTGVGSVSPASPIRFASGDTVKNLTFTPGGTAGTATITLASAAVVPPTSATTTVAGSRTFTVSAGTPGLPPGCPAPASNTVAMADMPSTSGPLMEVNLSSGQIGYSKLPVLSNLASEVTLSTTAGSGAITGAEVGISRCPGDIEGAKALVSGSQPCYFATTYITNLTLYWKTSAAPHPVYCAAPQSPDGPWYVNVRFNAAGRMFMQWAPRL